MPQEWVDELEKIAEARGERKSVIVRQAIRQLLEEKAAKSKKDEE